MKDTQMYAIALVAIALVAAFLVGAAANGFAPDELNTPVPEITIQYTEPIGPLQDGSILPSRVSQGIPLLVKERGY
jgi:hypothetical protein